jgi:hypothetical protein
MVGIADARALCPREIARALRGNRRRSPENIDAQGRRLRDETRPIPWTWQKDRMPAQSVVSWSDKMEVRTVLMVTGSLAQSQVSGENGRGAATSYCAS